MTKCIQENCDEQASVRVFWPGREPMDMCVACAEKARGVGLAIGCYIHMEPIAVSPKE